MNWEKRGQLYNVENKNDMFYSHCHKPTPCLINDSIIRVYFGVRDSKNRTRTTFVDIDCTDLYNLKIAYIHDSFVLDLGKIGAFDDSGANVCSVVKDNGTFYMYYIGWNPSTTVHTRNSIGVAISNDGIHFSRLYDGPILDRNKEEPYYTGAVDVLKENNEWKMWYTSGSQWKTVNNKPEIFYHIKYAYSLNGIDWARENIDCILPQNEFEATARPCVLHNITGVGKYQMYFSKRSIINFRIDKKAQYRAGYAVSFDEIHWDRKDEEAGIDVSNDGWDSEAIAYPYCIKIKDKLLMFYNGNGFGKTGFGYAISDINTF
jgi:predicted GH43/DUF377 family glycosyl hydrolase